MRTGIGVIFERPQIADCFPKSVILRQYAYDAATFGPCAFEAFGCSRIRGRYY